MNELLLVLPLGKAGWSAAAREAAVRARHAKAGGPTEQAQAEAAAEQQKRAELSAKLAEVHAITHPEPKYAEKPGGDDEVAAAAWAAAEAEAQNLQAEDEKDQQHQKEYEDFGAKMTKTGELNADETHAMGAWADQIDNGEITYNLRHQDEPEGMNPEVKSWTEHLDHAMAKRALHQDTDLHRGAGNLTHMFGTDDPNELVGKTFSDRSFLSASLDRGVAKEFADRAAARHRKEFRGKVPSGDKPLYTQGTIKLHVPKGTHALHLGGHTVFPEEQELLLPRDLKWRVTKATRKGTNYRLEAELAEEGAAMKKTILTLPLSKARPVPIERKE